MDFEEFREKITSYFSARQIEVSADAIKDAWELYQQTDSSIPKKKVSYKINQLGSLREVIDYLDDNEKVIVQRKNDGTQVVLAADEKIHLTSKTSQPVSIDVWRWITYFLDTRREDFMKTIELEKETGDVLHIEIYGRFLSPTQKEKGEMTWTVFDVIRNEEYIISENVFLYPNFATTYSFQKEDVMNIYKIKEIRDWLTTSEGIVLKQYFPDSLDEDNVLPVKQKWENIDHYTADKNFEVNLNMIGFKYKPFSVLIKPAVKNEFGNNIDHNLVTAFILEILNEKDKSTIEQKTFDLDEAISQVVYEHPRFSKIDRERIKHLIQETYLNEFFS